MSEDKGLEYFESPITSDRQFGTARIPGLIVDLRTPDVLHSSSDEVDFQQKSQKEDNLQQNFRQADDPQQNSRQAYDFQQNSLQAYDLQQNSLQAYDLQPNSRRAEDLQPNSRMANGIQPNSRRATSSGQKSFAANSPPPINGDNIIRKAKRRLSFEQYVAFLANIEELYDKKQTIDETSRKAEEILGTDNIDLLPAFQRFLTSNMKSTSQIDEIEMNPSTRHFIDHYYVFLVNTNTNLVSVEKQSFAELCKQTQIQDEGLNFLFQCVRHLPHEQFDAFMTNIKELNVKKQTVEETSRKAEEIFGTDNRDLFLSFQRLLNPPPKS